jgi:ferric-dicitrate binding protein FerR (iron transport regulator)
MSKSNDIWDIIARHHDHSLSDEETRILEEWLDSSIENRRKFHSIDRIWKASEEKTNETLICELDLEKDWNAVSRKMDQNPEEKRARVRHYRKIRKRQQFFSGLLKVAALVLVAITSGFFTLQFASQPVEETVRMPEFNEIVTDAAERAGIELADGSRVTLNAASKLIIPDRFSRDVREVELRGQAFFDIERDRSRPFHIKTGNAVVEVIGTSFDVRSYENEEEIQIVVKTGTVEVRNAGDTDDHLIVNEGYRATVHTENGKLQMERFENEDSYFSWMEDRIVFRNTRLKDVYAELERWYDVEFVITDDIQESLQEKFTANLKTRSVEEVLDVIRESMNVDYVVLEGGDRFLVSR